MRGWILDCYADEVNNEMVTWIKTSTGVERISDREYRLRPLLRHPKLGMDAVRRVLRLANRRKPLGYQLLARVRAGQLAELRGAGQELANAPCEGGTAVANRRMSAIGG